MSRNRGAGLGFARRLLLAQSAVVIAGAVTAAVIAALIAPGLFHQHLLEAGVANLPMGVEHADRAFTSALAVSLGVALLVAVVLSLGVAWWFTRRIQRSIAAVASTTADMAEGRPDTRVGPSGLGADFDRLGESINVLCERLAATDSVRRRLMSDLAHEMRTPVATITAQVEAIEDGVRDPDAQTLQTIRAAAGRLHRLAADLGAVSTADEQVVLTVQPVSVRKVVDDAVALACPHGADADVELAVDDVVDIDVFVDVDRIGQILCVLLDNAIRHTPSGGTVRIDATTAGGGIDIVVSDTGDGIAAEDLHHVFDRFYRGDSARSSTTGGSGIGLTIARSLAHAHGGSLTATTDGPGCGATFTLHLPRATRRRAGPRALSSPLR
ncbi:cell wall metabolism sensor histidine kinase WalK [Williamsia sp. CHRR-6]|uniref:sensor histidine kinase n=1 Tax=Williamsia sp. CHRR-6 TaxID=2835871 RepID=UPI001BD979AD|nr:HAMP domain-containing sensor histidine kinase [Williamsia sp. CHRR-6]MBT0567589.1 HAMP domain-containing histidine kinase [Williamsia sp. CHRR-6]